MASEKTIDTKYEVLAAGNFSRDAENKVERNTSTEDEETLRQGSKWPGPENVHNNLQLRPPTEANACKGTRKVNLKLKCEKSI